MVSAEGILLVAGGYLVGSIPTGVILARLFSARDIRREGSGNIGATNVYRVLGAKLGAMTLAGDVLKGVAPVFLIRILGGDEVWIASVALCTFLGHLYPLFLGFHGGKGVATALGVFVVIAPLVTAGAVLVFVVVVMRWKYVSLGSIAASASMPLLLGAGDCGVVYVTLSLMIAGLIFYRHGDNIRRLREGKEKKLSMRGNQGSP